MECSTSGGSELLLASSLWYSCNYNMVIITLNKATLQLSDRVSTRKGSPEVSIPSCCHRGGRKHHEKEPVGHTEADLGGDGRRRVLCDL